MTTKNNSADPEAPAGSRYDDALLCANWNPVIDLLAVSSAHASDHADAESMRTMSDEEADALLGRIYMLGG